MSIAKFIPIILSAFLFGCATSKIASYEDGSAVHVGSGGAKETYEDVDVWTSGTPPRKYVIVGQITDERVDGPLWMASQNRSIAKKVKKAGGHAAIKQNDHPHLYGVGRVKTYFLVIRYTQE